MASRRLPWLALVLFATSAPAATVGIQWVDHPLTPTLNALPGSTVTAQVSLDLLTGESSAGFISWFTNTTPQLTIGQQVSLAPGWLADQYPGPLIPAQLVYYAPNIGTILHGPFNNLIGEFEVNVASTPGDLLPLALAAQATPVGLINEAGHSYVWDARYHTTFPGYVAYGNFGNPGWGTNPLQGHQPTPNPLYVRVVPEPLTVAPLIMGGFALLFRRTRR